MPKIEKKYTNPDTIVTVVACKGKEEKHKDMPYSQAIIAKKQFERLGWYVKLFQQGYYQPFNLKTNNNAS